MQLSLQFNNGKNIQMCIKTTSQCDTNQCVHCVLQDLLPAPERVREKPNLRSLQVNKYIHFSFTSYIPGKNNADEKWSMSSKLIIRHSSHHEPYCGVWGLIWSKMKMWGEILIEIFVLLRSFYFFVSVSNCGRPPTVPNGEVVEASVLFLRYQCSIFYKRTGPETVMCYSDGTWSQVPTCRGKNKPAVKVCRRHWLEKLTQCLLLLSCSRFLFCGHWQISSVKTWWG